MICNIIYQSLEEEITEITAKGTKAFCANETLFKSKLVPQNPNQTYISQ
jgi:hypothetical protein